MHGYLDTLGRILRVYTEKNHFFCIFICIYQKKVVLLRSILKFNRIKNQKQRQKYE